MRRCALALLVAVIVAAGSLAAPPARDLPPTPRSPGSGGRPSPARSSPSPPVQSSPAAAPSPSPSAPAAEPALTVQIDQLIVRWRNEDADCATLKKEIEQNTRLFPPGAKRDELLENAGRVVDEARSSVASLAVLAQEAARISTGTAQVVEDLAKQGPALVEARGRASHPERASPAVRTSDDLRRISEEVRLAQLDLEARKIEVASLKKELDGALRRQNDATREVQGSNSSFARLTDLVSEGLRRGSSDPGGLTDRILAKKPALDELRRQTIAIREKVARANVEWNQHRLELAAGKLELCQIDVDLGQKVLEKHRQTANLAQAEVSKVTETSRQEKVEADRLRRESQKVAAQAEVERAEAQKLKESARKRDEELQRATEKGENQLLLDEKKRLTAEELQLAEDKARLAEEREKLSVAAAQAADAKSELATEQITQAQALARGLAVVMRDPKGTDALVPVREAVLTGSSTTSRRVTDLEKQRSSLVDALQLEKRRRSVIVERLEREQKAAGDSRQRALVKETVQALKDQSALAGNLIAAIGQRLDLLEQQSRARQELLRFYKETLATLDLYRRSETDQGTTSIREVLAELDRTGRAFPAAMRAVPTELRLCWNLPSSRHRLIAWLAIVLAFAFAWRLALLALRKAREHKLVLQSEDLLPVLTLAVRVCSSVYFYAALRLAFTWSGPPVSWEAALALPLLYLAAYLLAVGALRHCVTLAGGDPASGLTRWAIWAVRYAMGLHLGLALMEEAGAAAPLMIAGRVVLRVGILMMVVLTLLANRQALHERAVVAETGPNVWVRSLYNVLIGRLAVLFVLIFLVALGLKAAGLGDLAVFVGWAAIKSVLSLVGALWLFGRLSRPLAMATDAVVGGAWGNAIRIWVEAGAGLILGLVCAVFWVRFWIPDVRVGRILTSPIVIDLVTRVAGVGGVAVVTVGVNRMVEKAIVGFLDAMATSGGTEAAVRRSRTLQPLAISFARYTIFFVGAIAALYWFGFDPTPLLAGAGMLGLAVGFGAQSLVKDVITGLFIIGEDLVSVGDVVDIDGKVGQVEAVTVRTTQIRFYSGELRTIPNSEIRQIGNYNRGFMRAIVPVNVAHECDVERAISLLELLARRFHESHASLMLGPPEVHGIVEWAASSYQIRAVFAVRPGEQWGVERDFRRMVKAEFDRVGIEFPLARQVVYAAAPGRAIGPANVVPVVAVDPESDQD